MICLKIIFIIMCAQNFLLIYLVLSLLSAILWFITMISILSFILLFVSFALYIGLVNTDMGPFWYKFVVKFSNTWSGVEWWLCWVAYAASCCRCFSEFKDFKRKHSERWQSDIFELFITSKFAFALPIEECFIPCPDYGLANMLILQISSFIKERGQALLVKFLL